MGVVWFHSWWGTPYYLKLAAMPVLRQGEYGVHMFYVVSGFLITTLLLRERDRFGKISLRDFYIRRSLRIWPLYYAVVAPYVFVVRFFEPNSVRAASFFHYLPLLDVYLHLVSHGEMAWRDFQSRFDARGGRAVLRVLARDEPLFERSVGPVGDGGANPVANDYRRRLDRKLAAMGLVANENDP
jgi:hypothetical protein